MNSKDELNTKKHKYFYNLLNYAPGLLLLLFSMFALHSSLRLIEYTETTGQHHNQIIQEIQQLKNSQKIDFPNNSILEVETQQHFLEHSHKHVHHNFWNALFSKTTPQNLKLKEKLLYWSVIAIGLAGFILVVLNTDKLQKIKHANRDKFNDLALLENRLAAMESTFDGISIVDRAGHLTYMNKALLKLHNISYEDKLNFIGQDWSSLYNDEEDETACEEIISSLNSEGHWSGTKTIINPSGEETLTELSFMRLADGGFVGTSRDISEREQAQKEKEELQSQFFQAQKMEAIGRLAGGVAHDFNNILAAMNGYAEFLMEDLDEKSKQHKFAENILQAGMQARGLVDQILTFSRIRDTEIQNIDLITSVKESLSMIQASFPKRIEVQSDIDIDKAYIKGNATQISQVIMNLSVNAKDAMMGGRGKLNISLKKCKALNQLNSDFLSNDAPNESDVPSTKLVEVNENQTQLYLGTVQENHDYVVLEISDTGSGMSSSVMAHVFEPFFTTKPVDKGTGLGLSTVHGVIAAHKGAMIIDSTIEQGTSFEIFFPVIDEKDDLDEKTFTDDVDLSQCSILLVEDQKDVREMMRSMLERIGAVATVTTDGLHALDILRENPEKFDIVITDQNMPKMTGFEFIQEAYLDFPSTPFIILSGYSEQRLQKLIHEHPAVKATLRKPVSKQLLTQTLHDVLKQSKKPNIA